MSSNSNQNPIIHTTPPFSGGQAEVNLVKGDFDNLVWSKGRDVILDKNYRCPCCTFNDNQPQSGCKNCGGSGYIFIQRVKTRMVIQSQTLKTNFKEWSEEESGNINVTSLAGDKIAFMDRITVFDSLWTHNENIHFFTRNNQKIGRLDYPPVEVENIFLFQDNDSPLIRLTHLLDYTIEEDIIILDNKYFGYENATVSIRYRAYPTYHIIDVTRESMSSRDMLKKVGNFPVHAIARRSHYVVDNQNIDKNFLLNNSYTESCSDTVTIDSNVLGDCSLPADNVDPCQSVMDKFTPSELKECIIPNIDYTIPDNIQALTPTQISLIKLLP